MPRLIVLKAHSYESRARAVGSEYDATEADARLLVLAGNARYKDGAPDAQSYLTRDLAAAPRATRRRTRQVAA